MPAVTQAQYFGASATLPAGVNAEIGITFNREDTQNGTTPIPIPVAAATNYSWLKVIQIAVTGTSSTTLSNRTIRSAGSLSAGLGWFWITNSQASWATAFNQSGGSKSPADTIGANNATTPPSGFTSVTTSAVTYDNSSQSTGVTGIDSALLCAVLLAVDGTYGGGAGTASIGQIILAYNEG